MKKVIVVSCLLLVVFGCGSKKKTSQSKKYHGKEYRHKTKKGTYIHTGEVINPEETTSKRHKSSYESSAEEYIQTYKGYAMNEMREFKIPASITLAQGILESGNGKSELTRNSNNHFGIKCHDTWGGDRVYHDDDRSGECFRRYKDPAKSFRDHSLFLKNRKRYAQLFTLAPDDYVGWARGLKKAGYATDRRYPAKLIGIIERFELYKYDEEVLGRKSKSYHKTNSNVYKSTGSVTYHIVERGDTLYNISKRYGTTVEKIKKDNYLSSNIISIGQRLKIIR
ncbi:MAG: glucosaminidase domain-containing protein [Flavobacteriaceae bacterium]|nr:glucosaminidase domain-containing protein [Flavobacteriaceae bacterium]